MKKVIPIIVVVLFVLVGWFLVKNNSNPKTENNINSPEAQTEVGAKDSTPVASDNQKDKIMTATLHTNKGDITIEFLSDLAPNTVANFTKLAGANFYDGVKFHRVIKGFMIQGGDPLTKDDSKQALWGTGGPGYQFADELGQNNHNDVGTISMANAGPNTNGSQFFINTAANNFLDGKHTVFGKVTAGMDVVTAIESVKTAPGDRPIDPVVINSITLK
jgi:cyclophilin family peptidyl-prolyl cis-trans isomerase